MKFLNRLKQIPWENFSFFLISAVCLFSIYRFTFPVPINWFFPSFLLQFCFGFFPQLYSRKSGRIFTATGALLLPRFTWLSEPNLPFHMTDLVGLFLGAILGILLRELTLILLGRAGAELPKQSDLFITGWMIRNPLSANQQSLFFQTPFYFLFFLFVLFACVFLQGFGLSIFYGLGIPDFFYLPGISSRVFLSVPVIILMSISFPVLYFFAEERFSTHTSRESIVKHLFFGIGIGFLIQLLILLMQTAYLPTFFSIGGGTSILADRYPGLFIDSGSSSWILPTLGFLFIHYWYKKTIKTKEKFSYFVIGLIILIVTYLGSHQAKTFWVVWIGLLLISGLWTLINRLVKKSLLRWVTRVGAFVLIPFLIGLLLWAFSNIQSTSPLKELSKRYVAFQSNFASQKNFQSFKQLDATRFELLSATGELIVKSPLFGHGLGSLPILLKDNNRTGTKISNELIDIAPNFFANIILDIGLVGAAILFLLVGLFVWERENYLNMILLLTPFMFGFQVQHADGAFVAIFLLFYPLTTQTSSRQSSRNSNWFKYTILILAIGLPIHYLLFYSSQFLNSGIGSEFRQERLNFFQIQSSVKIGETYEFHNQVFEWKLGKSGALRQGTLRIKSEDKDLLIELIWKNGGRIILNQSVMEEKNPGIYLWTGSFPAGSEFVVLKVNRKSKLLMSTEYFSSEGELIL